MRTESSILLPYLGASALLTAKRAARLSAAAAARSRPIARRQSYARGRGRGSAEPKHPGRTWSHRFRADAGTPAASADNNDRKPTSPVACKNSRPWGQAAPHSLDAETSAGFCSPSTYSPDTTAPAASSPPWELAFIAYLC